MSITEKLQELRGTLTGCHVSAFIDLSSKMVLAVDARSKQPQERLDQLAERAGHLFRTPCIAEDGAASSHPTCVVTPLAENTEIFLRSSDSAVEAIGLICGPQVDLPQALEQCHGILAMLDEDR